MRSLAFVLCFAACGGSQKSAQTMPANDAPDPLRKEGPVAAPPPPAAVDLSTMCKNRPDDFGPVVLTAEGAQIRHGLAAKAFADAPSTKEKPIEVCGIEASQKWLMEKTCADGSKAYRNPMQVAQSRAGNVGPGGHCASIIDHYVAKCPEGGYDVYMDVYMCGPNESF